MNILNKMIVGFNIALNVLILLLAVKVVVTTQYVNNVRQEHIWQWL